MIKRVESAIRVRLDVICREAGITRMQYVALSVLHVHPGMSSAQLAVRSFVSAQSGNEIVAALERMGYIERTPDSTNSRILRIQLTDEGIAMVNRCDAAVDELEAKMLRGIAPGDVRLVSRTLDAVIENLS